jgi:hypothetical protein
MFSAFADFTPDGSKLSGHLQISDMLRNYWKPVTIQSKRLHIYSWDIGK